MTRDFDAADRQKFERSRRIPQQPSHSPISPLKPSSPTDVAAKAPLNSGVSLPNPFPSSAPNSADALTRTPPLDAPSGVLLQEPPPFDPEPCDPIGKPWLRVPKTWQFWGAAAIVAFSGVGLLSTAILLKLPALPNCPNVFWPTASASLRLYCAQLAAEKRTVNDLLYAIDLVNALPQDHPLRSEVDRSIELWAREILHLCDDLFQRGELSKAIEGARKIPAKTAAAKLVEQHIKSWQRTWSKAEAIYKDAEAALGKRDLRQAFLIATRLLSLGNTYWETSKYKELTDIITATREDIDKLNQAQELTDQGGLQNFVAAIKVIDGIQESSRVYQEALKMTKAIGQEMLSLANAALDRHDYDDATRIAEQIPPKAGLESEVQDFSAIADATSRAWGGTVGDLQGAIAAAQKLTQGRPLYGRAQALISYWQLEIQDVMKLDKARELARGGRPSDLQAAIVEAQAIPAGNPRAAEAQREIDSWVSTIQTAEDRPILDRALSIASQGDLPSLQSAIDQANQVGAGRALSNEADQLISDWSDRLQRLQDQPRLERARELAYQGNYQAAINVASEISSGRALSYEAQSEIANWSTQLSNLQARVRSEAAPAANAPPALQPTASPNTSVNDNPEVALQTAPPISLPPNGEPGQMDQAYAMARTATLDGLLGAIQFAAQIPANSSYHSEAANMIDRWSWQILQLAESTAGQDPAQAVAIAGAVPPNTAAYGDAQARIQEWRQKGPNQ